jgi:hypothetical protein
MGEPIGNFDQPVLPIADPAGFAAVRTAIERSFSSSVVQDFLRSLDRSGLRIRHFEQVLDRGILGAAVKEQYSRLGDADQGQIREFYLASLERVLPELRQKFFKLYAYY